MTVKMRSGLFYCSVRVRARNQRGRGADFKSGFMQRLAQGVERNRWHDMCRVQRGWERCMSGELVFLLSIYACMQYGH